MEKRNLTKLLPAAAVLTAVTITGLKTQAENQKSVSSSENIMNSEELGDLMLAAYPAREEQEISRGEKRQKRKQLKPQKRKPVESKKAPQKHCLRKQQLPLVQARAVPPLRWWKCRNPAIKMELIREAAPDLAEPSQCRSPFPAARSAT